MTNIELAVAILRELIGRQYTSDPEIIKQTATLWMLAEMRASGGAGAVMTDAEAFVQDAWRIIHPETK